MKLKHSQMLVLDLDFYTSTEQIKSTNHIMVWKEKDGNNRDFVPLPPTLTDHAFHLHEQVEKTGVADGHVGLCVP